MRQPGPCVRFFFEAVALQSKNMACARPQCNNAKRTFSSHFALHFANGILKGKSPAPKLIKFADKSQSQPWCSHPNTIYIQCPAAKDNSITRAAAAPSNLDAAIPMRFAATRTHPCSHYNAICFRTLQNTKGQPIVLETIQTAPAAHTRYHSSPAAATLHGKTQGFVLRLPPQNNSHATVMQPLQCDLHPHVAEHQGRTDYPRNRPSCISGTHEVPFIAGCSHFTRNNTRFRAPASSPKHTPCNSHAAITMRFAATRTHPCSHYNAICIHTLQNTKGKPIVLETIQTAPAAHTRYHSLPAAATLHRKRQGFVLRLPPQNKPHATVMQPLQCDLHPHVAEHQGRTDYPRKGPSCTSGTHEVPFIAGCSHFTRKNTRFRGPASSPQKNHATVMQPLECVLQLHVPIHAAITMRFASTRCRTPRENRLCSKRSKPHPPHTRGTVHRRLQPLYTEKHKVSCSGFPPKTNPMQQSCSHYNAFCSYTYPSMQPLQCDLHPHVAEHQGRTDCARNDPKRTRRTHEVPFIAGCSHFTRKNTRFRAPASSPKQTPCNSHAAITMRFAATRTHPSSHYNAICIPASLGHHFC